MSFNIFGPASKNSIRVGYISTDRGFVDNVTICEANDYAKSNPGTRFIFKTRNFIKYLNINEVNKLTPDDILPTESGCSGITLGAECGKPQAYFYGGGGVGVQGNPVFGVDGSLLAVDLVHGGFGYQYPPIVEVKDNCGVGVGAVTRAVLGEVVETVEYYDQEDDFEDYEICEPTESGYGLRYTPDGKVLGDWDPTLYANLTKDPIAVEIKEYQDFLQKLQTPWWTTRTKNPLRVTSQNRTTRVKHNVTYPAWSDFLNKYAISPVPASNVPGSDFAGQEFTLEWEEEFPYTGEYVFRAQADNIGKFYLDNQKLLETAEFRQNQTPKKIAKTVQAGVHRIRIDLYNQPIIEKTVNSVTTPPTPPPTPTSTTVDEWVRIADEFVEPIRTPSAIRGSAPITGGTFHRYDLGTWFKDKRIRQGGDWNDTNPNTNYIENPFNSNQRLTLGTNRGGIFAIAVWEKKSTTVTKPVTASTPSTSKSQSSTQTTGSQSRKVFNTIDYINKANRPLWRTNVYGRGGFINEYGVCPFDTTVQLEDNPYAGTHRIVWDNISFPVDGNYTIEIEVDDNVTLTFSGQSGETVITKKGFSVGDKSTGKSTETRFFKAGTYKIAADLEQIPGGKFGFSSIKGINPMALAVNIETVTTLSPIVSPKSWNENPMGVTLTIDAPLPPIPQEPIVQQEGRCPNNPIWSTRFPNAKQKWWPVKFDSRSWSKFMNRYAISPIPPLSQKGSDGGGVVYQNSWNLDIPYDGFYALKGTVDNGGRILIDDKEVARGGGVSFKGGTVDTKQKLDSFKVENPQSTKLFLTKGKHTIQIEVENEKTETFENVDQKIFSTSDWAVASTVKTSTTEEKIAADEWVRIADEFVAPIRTPSAIRGSAPITGGTFHKQDLGTWFRNQRIRQGGDWNDTNPYTNYIENPFNSNQRLTLGVNRGSMNDAIFAIAVWEKKSTQTTSTKTTTSLAGGTVGGAARNGVTYSGPTLATYRSGTLGPFLTPAFKDDADYRANNMGRTWISKWSNVNFPENGQYTLKAEADDEVIVRIDGVEVGRAKVFEGVKTFTFNTTKGNKAVEMEFRNIPGNSTSTFLTNPVVFNAIITKKVSKATGITKPWTENPIGISAILIPPPCPKRVKGKGVVTEVIVDDPGNGFPRPGTGDYPVSLRLKNVVVEDTGINYNCGIDQIQITPSNGAVLDYECDTFGRIINVKVLNPGLGFTTYPEIAMVTPADSPTGPTGINATFRPQFEVVRDPIVTEPQKLIQVTDLVGLKQTGYVDGRPYYGAVFFKDGISYAGFYETPGDLVQVYATLQESIDAEVTTAPSAIQRQGTDVTSNDPRLNLPGTPENLI